MGSNILLIFSISTYFSVKFIDFFRMSRLNLPWSTSTIPILDHQACWQTIASTAKGFRNLIAFMINPIKNFFSVVSTHGICNTTNSCSSVSCESKNAIQYEFNRVFGSLIILGMWNRTHPHSLLVKLTKHSISQLFCVYSLKNRNLLSEPYSTDVYSC